MVGLLYTWSPFLASGPFPILVSSTTRPPGSVFLGVVFGAADLASGNAISPIIHLTLLEKTRNVVLECIGLSEMGMMYISVSN